MQRNRLTLDLHIQPPPPPNTTVVQTPPFLDLHDDIESFSDDPDIAPRAPPPTLTRGSRRDNLPTGVESATECSHCGIKSCGCTDYLLQRHMRKSIRFTPPLEVHGGTPISKS